ncbi:DVU0772 family protein [Desulfobacterium sp. N47]|uniref:Uncharacterized protein n=1 Tax=uncultured Desulfobacterium sp. TaxID=201089 RepID=E1YJX9_9BACT|nr:hypothetical protein N47_E50950 [uncultured Desulfobacterium sp.]
MLSIDEIRNDQDLLDNINWEMTPEEAVRLYLEWGNNWTRGNFVIRGKEDVSYYFVVNTWGENPVVYLMRRNSDEAKELAELELPENIKKNFLESIGNNKGVYSIEGDVRDWLKKELLGS